MEQEQTKNRHTEYTKRRKIKQRSFIKQNRNSSCCSYCGSKRDLQYHHVFNKKYEISDIIYKKYSNCKLMSEIDKCVFLCNECHKKIHANWFNKKLRAFYFRALIAKYRITLKIVPKFVLRKFINLIKQYVKHVKVFYPKYDKNKQT